MKKVSVVILSYKGHKDSLELLNSLRRINKGNLKLNILIVDNFPKDPIKADIKDFRDLNLEVIYNKKNLGFSGGNNVGIDYCLRNGADYVVILNNDTIVDPFFIAELVKTAEEENAGIVVPKIYFAKGFEFHKDRYKERDLGKVLWYAGGAIDWKNIIGNHRGLDEVDRGQFDEDGETQMATGCCFLVKKEVFEKVGQYDKRYFLYFEDADFSERVKRAGYKIFYNPKSIVWHKNAQSTGVGSDLQTYFQTRNRLLFGLTYAPMRVKLALIRESLSLLISGKHWQRRGIIDFYLGRFGKGSYPSEK
ncbi:MAG: glycosyltransferase family 2 protein [Candidatus Levybacteria bacterium]|nr:glycosyltransferase family 2 protein [Candidatus Levybacteria bacterium]